MGFIDINIQLIAGLRTVIVKGDVVAEAQMMVRCGSIVKGGAIAHVIDGGVMTMLRIVAAQHITITPRSIIFL